MVKDIQKNESYLLPDGYDSWRKEIIALIEQAKFQTSINVNAELLALYWHVGKNIIQKQSELGWGTQVVTQLSKDLSARFPEDRGYSERNLRSMKRFAAEYPDFPILQVPLAKLGGDEIWQVAHAELCPTLLQPHPLSCALVFLSFRISCCCRTFAVAFNKQMSIAMTSVLMAACDCLVELCMDSKAVRLSDLGIFKMGVHAEGAEEEKLLRGCATA